MTTPNAKISDLLHAIADPARRKILRALKENNAPSVGREPGLCASDIEARIPLSQPTISHHMAILRKSGLVQATRAGQRIFYRRHESTVKKFLKTLKREL